MNPNRFLLAATALLIALFAGGNLLAQSWLAGARIDFTENKLYTLSEGSETILKTLGDPVELTFVYTASVGQDYPAVRAYAVRVRQLLQGYAARSGGKLIVREIDPLPFSEDEDEALAAGLAAIDTNGGDPLYLGIIGRNSVDDQSVIPFLAPERETSLEYDLSRMIARLDQPEPPRIGLLSTLPGMTTLGDETGYSVLQDLRKSFQLEQIGEDFTTLPPEIDVLMLAHPPALTDWQLWQIDQFMLTKGRALILLDPAAKTAQGSGPFGMIDRQIRSDLDIFSSVWGVSLSEDALADTQTALPVEAPAEAGRDTVLRHPLFLSIPPGLMSRDSLITADLGRPINLGAPGALQISDEAETTIEILMQSGPAPAAIPAQQAAGDLPADETLALYTPGEDGPAALAARITGPLVSAFPDGAPAITGSLIEAELARAAAAEAGPAVLTSKTDAQIIILSDADMLDDGLHTDFESGVAFADNIAFVLNALDSLAGGSELMKLRARAPGVRRMTRVDKLRDVAQEKYFSEQARLEARLNAAQSRLEELQSIGGAGGFFEGDLGSELSDEERSELAQLRSDMLTTRASLRQIERDFRAEIDGLEGWLRLFTVFFGPFLVALAGLGVWYKSKLGVKT